MINATIEAIPIRTFSEVAHSWPFAEARPALALGDRSHSSSSSSGLDAGVINNRPRIGVRTSALETSHYWLSPMAAATPYRTPPEAGRDQPDARC